MMRCRFPFLPLLDVTELGDRAEFVAESLSMERDRAFSAEQVDGEKELSPTEFRLGIEEVFHGEDFMRSKHFLNGLFRPQISCAHDCLLSYSAIAMPPHIPDGNGHD